MFCAAHAMVTKASYRRIQSLLYRDQLDPPTYILNPVPLIPPYGYVSRPQFNVPLRKRSRSPEEKHIISEKEQRRSVEQVSRDLVRELGIFPTRPINPET